MYVICVLLVETREVNQYGKLGYSMNFKDLVGKGKSSVIEQTAQEIHSGPSRPLLVVSLVDSNR